MIGSSLKAANPRARAFMIRKPSVYCAISREVEQGSYLGMVIRHQYVNTLSFGNQSEIYIRSSLAAIRQSSVFTCLVLLIQQ